MAVHALSEKTPRAQEKVEDKEKELWLLLSHLKRASPISNWVPCALRIGKRSIYFCTDATATSALNVAAIHPPCPQRCTAPIIIICVHPWLLLLLLLLPWKALAAAAAGPVLPSTNRLFSRLCVVVTLRLIAPDPHPLASPTPAGWLVGRSPLQIYDTDTAERSLAVWGCCCSVVTILWALDHIPRHSSCTGVAKAAAALAGKGGHLNQQSSQVKLPLKAAMII